MKKFLSSFLVFLISAILMLGLNAVVLAEDGATDGATATPATASTPQIDLEQIIGGSEIGGSGLQDFKGRIHNLSSVDPGADVITSIIFTVIDFLKYLLGGVTVIYVIIAGFKMISTSGKADEVGEKQKENLKYIIYGLLLVIVADELVTKVFFGDYGECIASASNAKECAMAGSSLIKGIYSLILAVIASIALLSVVISAFRLVTSYGDEDTIGTEKRRIMVSLVSLIIAATAEFVVKGLIFREGGTKPIDIAGAQSFVYSFTNFVAAFIGAGAFGMLFYGGYLYVVSFGNEEQTGKSKKIMVSAIIGILIALAAFGIVTTITSFSSGRELSLPGSLPGLPGTPDGR